MTIPIYISARSSDPLENLVIHAMKKTFLDYDGDEIVDKGEDVAEHFRLCARGRSILRVAAGVDDGVHVEVQVVVLHAIGIRPQQVQSGRIHACVDGLAAGGRSGVCGARAGPMRFQSAAPWPARVILPISQEPLWMLPRRSTSLPTARRSANIWRRLPAMVISSTGKAISPFSTQKPLAPRE